MYSFVEIYLGKSSHSPALVDIEQVRGFYSVAHRKRDLLEDLPPNGIFTAERLEELGEFRIK